MPKCALKWLCIFIYLLEQNTECFPGFIPVQWTRLILFHTTHSLLALARLLLSRTVSRRAIFRHPQQETVGNLYFPFRRPAIGPTSPYQFTLRVLGETSQETDKLFSELNQNAERNQNGRCRTQVRSHLEGRCHRALKKEFSVTLKCDAIKSYITRHTYLSHGTLSKSCT